MKINKIILSVSSLAVCGTLSAQDLRGVVRDADNQPLVGASVYWEVVELHSKSLVCMGTRFKDKSTPKFFVLPTLA